MSNSLALCIALVASAGASVGSVHAMTLAKNSKTDYCIVVGADAIAPEKTAAKELSRYLKQVTGAEFSIREESKVKPSAPQILVGPSARLKKLAAGVDWKALGHDGIVIRTVGNKLLLAGGRTRGTLYAVYSFLEDTVGCRWWTGTESTIPHKPTLNIPTLNVTYTPKLRYREAFYRDPIENPEFAAKLKLNGHHYKIPAEYGDHYSIIGWCHTFYQWLPPNKHFADHPEWFSLINGKRSADGAQLCLTNEQMRKEMLRVVLRKIEDNPTAGIISVSQNDWHGPCQCEKCRAVVKEEGSESGPLIRFVNALAEDIEKVHPEVLVETLAYQYTRSAPLLVKPRKNVVVRLCTIECSFTQPLDSDANAAFRDDIRKWRAIAPNLYVWDYVTNFANYIYPQPNMRVLAPNLRFFADNNVIGVFEQGDCATSVGDFVRLRAWLLAHLEWDPTRDADKLRKDFMRGYYGPAAPSLIQYLDLIHDSCERAKARIGCYNQSTAYLGLTEMTEATRLFEKAEQAVAGDPVLARRVRRERMPLDHVWLLRCDGLKREAEEKQVPYVGPKDPAAACEEFISLAHEWKAGNYSEGQGFDSYVPALEARFAPPPPLPDEFAKLPKGDCVQLTCDRFTLFRAPEFASIVDDPAACIGRAARMPSNHIEWAVQCRVTDDVAQYCQGEWKCYLVARTEGAATGQAFQYGIYGGNAPATMIAGADVTNGPTYHTLFLGAYPLTTGMYFWVAPTGNSAIKWIYVDRVILVRKNAK